MMKPVYHRFDFQHIQVIYTS